MHSRIGRPPYALGVALWGMTAILTFAFGFAVAYGADSRGGGYIVWMVSVGLLAIPPLPLHVRRLHDVGLSGWWLLKPDGLNLTDWASWLVLIPYGLTCVAGFVWPGYQGSNRYGPAPNRSTRLIIVSGAVAAGLFLLLAVATAAFFTPRSSLRNACMGNRYRVQHGDYIRGT